MESATDSSSRGYYCHKCNATIAVPVTDYTCPLCHLGFVEKLQDDIVDITSTSFTDRTSGREDHNSVPVVLDNVYNISNISNNFVVTLRGAADNNQGNSNDNRPSSSNGREASSDSGRPNDRRRLRNQHRPVGIEYLLNEFLSGMSRTGTQNMDNNGPLFLVSNPGDYAWGREGLDTIITQLLNQIDSSGPPPLHKDKIRELPFIRITEQQVSENMQCSVCWDLFRMAENVRQLPCEHIYHDICIVPWLELHGTCPICRKLLSDDVDARLVFPHATNFEALLSDVPRLSILQSGFSTNSSGSIRGSRIHCLVCNEYGHIARECSNRPFRCYSCREVGHMARDCPTRRVRANNGGARYGNVPVLEAVAATSSASYTPPSFNLCVSLSGDEDSDYLDWNDDYDDSISFYSENGSDNMHPYDGGFFDFLENNTDSYTGGSSSSATYVGGIRDLPHGASVGTSGSIRTPANRDRKRKSPFKCYNCNKPGHFARNCRNKQCGNCSKRGHETGECWFAPRQPFRNLGHMTSSLTFTSKSRGRTYGENSNQSTSTSSVSNGSNLITSGYPGPSYSGRQNIECWKCHRRGHISRECPTNHQQ